MDALVEPKLYETKYQCWKRHNAVELHETYERRQKYYNKGSFERFCREMFERV